MPSRTTGYAGQAVSACRNRLARQRDAGDVGKYQSAVGLNDRYGWFRTAQRSDNDRGLVFGDQLQILRQTGIRGVGHQIGTPGADGFGTLGLARLRQTFGNLLHPSVQLADWARIGRRKGTNDARLAGCEHHVWAGDQEHGGRKNRQGQGKTRDYSFHGVCVVLANGRGNHCAFRFMEFVTKGCGSRRRLCPVAPLAPCGQIASTTLVSR